VKAKMKTEHVYLLCPAKILRKALSKGYTFYSTRKKNAIEGLFQNLFSLYYSAFAEKRYYKYQSQIFNSTCVKVLLN
jgi:hypothetical protein